MFGTTLCMTVGTTRRPRARFKTGFALCTSLLSMTNLGQDAAGRWEDREVGGTIVPAPAWLICLSPGSCHWAASYAEYAAPSLGATASALAAWTDAVAECL
jgi:hypothetical protein